MTSIPIVPAAKPVVPASRRRPAAAPCATCKDEGHLLVVWSEGGAMRMRCPTCSESGVAGGICVAVLVSIILTMGYLMLG